MEWNLEWLVRTLLGRAWAILLAVLLGAGGTVLGTWQLVTPQYESSVTLYVIQTYSNKNLADSFSVIVTMRESLMEVIGHTGMNTSHLQLEKQIRVEQQMDTDFLEVIVTSPDPEEAVMLANAIGSLLPQQVAQIMEGTSVKLVGEAIPALEPSWPSYSNAAFLGGALGGMLAVAVALGEGAWRKTKKDRSV